MDGNHSLLVVSHQISCEDVQAPLIINIVLGLPANMFVMWLILAGPGDKAAEIFSLNQAVCDVAICVANIISLIARNVMPDAADFTFLQKTVRFTWGFMFSGRPLFLSCVSFERYLAVVHPVTFLKYKRLRYRLAGTIVSWLTVLVCCITLIWVPDSAIHYVGFGMAATWFLVLLFFCIETLRVLVRPGPGDGNNGMNSAKLKAFQIIFVISVSVFVAYLPYVIATILFGYSLYEDSYKMHCVATYFALIAGFIPPLFYIHRAGKLQHCIKDSSNMTPNA